MAGKQFTKRNIFRLEFHQNIKQHVICNICIHLRIMPFIMKLDIAHSSNHTMWVISAGNSCSCCYESFTYRKPKVQVGIAKRTTICNLLSFTKLWSPIMHGPRCSHMNFTVQNFPPMRRGHLETTADTLYDFTWNSSWKSAVGTTNRNVLNETLNHHDLSICPNWISGVNLSLTT